ncbi:PepSY domain-containing protein [Paenibacillus thailandensis]|uniref:PepSY domain-containing protein n=1 Tax=Paenibacillus thailandensis TaxID=393250 RepID=A0ABW5R031_9BACL
MRMRFAPKTIIIAAALLIIVVAAAAGIRLYAQAAAAPETTKEDAVREVTRLYGGTVEQAESFGDGYIVRLRTDKGLYELTVRKDGSGINGIRRLDGGNGEDVPAAPSATPGAGGPSDGEGLHETPVASPGPAVSASPAPSVLITKEEAAALALKQVQGKVEEIDLEEKDGKSFYLVEIDTADGREATVQLHAVSGELMSVTWDDDEDDEVDDEDAADDDE